jgi:hypothetical protein
MLSELLAYWRIGGSRVFCISLSVKRSELLLKCETAALLLRDAEKKVSDALRHLEPPPVRKPPAIATSKVIVMPLRRTGTDL